MKVNFLVLNWLVIHYAVSAKQRSCTKAVSKCLQIVASDGTTASFMWELLKDPLVKAVPMKATFAVNYSLTKDGPSRRFCCPFDIQDYTTLFVIRTKLEPGKGSDFCRASQVCCLHLTVQRVSDKFDFLFLDTIIIKSFVQLSLEGPMLKDPLALH